ncbi:secondary carrier transporter [Lithospermum erythrorhizon]|uniref:Secondary carrier transporter n=1 Tax=Lithospermum erythrorhizon TaxID=34254 RepID=A0AAV3NXJ9_LITER
MEWSRLLHLVITPLAPSLLIAISYVDPGKFAAAVEGGSRFGSDLVWLVFFFNVAAILCQYLPARVAIATGENLAQICNKEYDKVTCLFLGVQAELSMILLDLTMVLGSAHGLNAILGIDLFTCVLLTIMTAFLFPLISTLHEKDNGRLLCVCLALAVLLLYFFGVLMGQPDTSFSSGGILDKLGGDSAFVLMGLLGASIMPHNFYLHSSIVQREQQSEDLSKEAACYKHLFVTVCIFSCVFLLNYALMNLAANVFYSAGLVLLTFQDALSLLDQAYRSSLVPFTLVLILFVSNQIISLTWNYGRQIVINEFFRIEIPVWLHYATIRILVIVPALCCVWSAGAEGIYQLLLLSQVLVALLLPSSVIPLFRVASSRAIMGAFKISYVTEFVALLIFICMIGLKAIFIKEMVFGSSEWASYLRSSVGDTVPVSYVTLLVIASGSFCFMLWLAATPLKSASYRLDAHVWEQTSVPESLVEQYQYDISVSTFVDEPVKIPDPVAVMEKSVDTSTQDASMTISDLSMPDTLLDSEMLPHSTAVEGGKSEVSFSGFSMGHSEVLSTGEKVLGATAAYNEAFDGQLHDVGDLKNEPREISEKPQRTDGGSQNVKADAVHSWGPEEVLKEVSESSPADGPPSYRSLSGNGDEPGSGTGSLSRLAGLGRGARRQLTGILDDFWGQLFDFHGQPTQEARAKKLDVLLGLDVKVDAITSASGKVGNRKDSPGYFLSSGRRDSDSFSHSSIYNSPKQQGLQGYLDTSYGGQRDSSSTWSSRAQLLDAYARSSITDSFDASERRYSSVRIPATSAGIDQQPATVHGHELASYINQIAKERGSGYLNGQLDLSALKSTPSLISGYGDSTRRSLAQKPLSSLSNQIPPGFHNVSVARNNSSHTQRRPYYDLSSPSTIDSTSDSDNVKKFHSLPDISGLRVPGRDSQYCGNSSQWEKFTSSSQSLSTFEQNYSRTGGGMPAGFSEYSPTEVCRDAFSLQFSSGSGTGSLWSRQPYEQFRVAEKSLGANGQPIGSVETVSAVDPEGKIIQSFRYCILRLLKLEGSGWLFKQNDGVDEDLMGRVAARERFHYEAETDQMNQPFNADYAKSLISLSPYCGEGCIYRNDLILSFGVWCIRRILELSLMESRPELWGKYTYVLNRLQGIVDLAFYRTRSPPTPCFCLDIPPEWQQSSNTTALNGSLPPTPKIVRGKLTNVAMMLELIKDVEIAISCRKGRSGTAAGDVAFPKGKENLASVLKRYKRRLSSKPVGSQ